MLWHFEQNPNNPKELLLKCIKIALESKIDGCVYMVSKQPRITVTEGEKLPVEYKICDNSSIPDSTGQRCITNPKPIPLPQPGINPGEPEIDTCKSYSVFNGKINCEELLKK